MSNPLGKLFNTVLKTKTQGNALKPVAAGSSGSSNEVARQAMSQLSKLVTHVMDGPEKEWTCWCGHKFRAAGEWYPTEACYCEAPKCPNPTFFLEGKGRLMLEAQAQGKDPKSVLGGSTEKTLPKGGSMGSRFK
jgi:hypothetical protein